MLNTPINTILQEIVMKTLVHFIEMHKDSNFEVFKFYSAGKLTSSYSYKRLYQDIIKKASILHHHFNINGEIVLVEGENDYEFITNFFALQFSGNVPVPVTTSMWITDDYYKSIIESIIATTDARTFFLSKNSKKLLKSKNINFVLPEDWENIDVVESFIPINPKEEDLAFIQFSSGSTGNPKGVKLSHFNVYSNLEQIRAELYQEGEYNHGTTWLPFHHDMGLIGGVLTPLFNHFAAAIMSPYDFAVNPSRWLKVISETKSNMIMSSNSGYHITAKKVKNANIDKYDLSNVRFALCGAEPINEQTLKAFCETFKECGFKEKAFLPCYGMAENTLAISFHRGNKIIIDKVDRKKLLENNIASLPNHNNEDEILTFVSCGKPLLGIELKIVNKDGVEIENRNVGEILVKSPSMTKGYYKRDDINKDLFLDGFLKTGDLGYISDGNLFITGRKKDVIILRGLNVNAEEVESRAMKISDVRPGRVVAVAQRCQKNESEEIRLIVETKVDFKYISNNTRKIFQENISKEISKYIPIGPEQISVVAPGTILKTTSGKIKRQFMKKKFDNGLIRDDDFMRDFFSYKIKETYVKSVVATQNIKNTFTGLLGIG